MIDHSEIFCRVFFTYEIPSLESQDVFEGKLTAADVAKVRELLPNAKIDLKPITEEERGNLSTMLRL